MFNDDNGAGSDASVVAHTSEPGDVFLTVADDQVDLWNGRPGGETVTFDQAVEEVLRDADEDGLREDWQVEDLNEWVFGLVGGFAMVASKDGRACLLRDTAFSHVCERVKAPSRYLKSIPTRYSVPSLNWGLKSRSDGPAFIRLAGGEARAVLSQRYGAFDDKFVFPQLRTNLAAAGLLDTVCARVVATGLTTLVRLGIPGEAFAIPGTDEIAEIAMDFTNGEVGNRACHLAPSVYLTRGGLATRRGGVRIRHLGSTDRLAEEFREAVPEALAGARLLRSQIVAAVDRAISDIAGEADKLRTLGLTLSEAREVVRKVASGSGVALPHDTAEWGDPLTAVGDVRAYDVFAAIAGLGDGKGVDRRLELEEVAAKYLAKATK